jgi:hypothetical protein
MVNGDRRGYLAWAANAHRIARWYRAHLAWDDASGYGAVEASRALRDEVTSGVATIPANRGAG